MGKKFLNTLSGCFETRNVFSTRVISTTSIDLIVGPGFQVGISNADYDLAEGAVMARVAAHVSKAVASFQA